MEYTYEIIQNFNSEVIKRTDENSNESFIPQDPANSDYQVYLAQLDQETN